MTLHLAPALDAALASVGSADCSPYIAALDEASYVEAILPLMSPACMLDTREDDAIEAALHSEPIPGHFHYLDAGYW